ncbi:MAG TPA: hypothetical protein VF584_26645 [Longimicrobium sp.]
MALGRQAGFQVTVAGGVREVAREVLAGDLHVWPGARPFFAAEHAGAEGHASVRASLAREPEEVSGVFAETELALLRAERLLDRPLGEADLPDAPGARVHPIDHQVEVRVLAVVVRDDYRLMLRELQVREEPVGHLEHECPVDGVGQVEADRQVVDRGRGWRRRGESRHHGGAVVDGRRPDVPRLQPLDAAGLRTVGAAVEVIGLLPEAGPECFVADHRSVTAARISRSASVAASDSPPNPAARAASIIS